MRVVSWNILHPDHVNVYPNVDSKYLEWEHRKEAIFKRLRNYNADIICLQEVDSSRIKEFEDEFKEYSITFQNDKTRTKKLKKWLEDPESKKPNTLVCATLVRTEFGTVIGSTVGSRTLTVSVELIDSGKKSIRITNVHLESGKGTTDIHIKHLSKLSESDIIIGDFNDFPGEPAIEYLTEHGFTNGFKKKLPRMTFKDGIREWVIDFVFYKNFELKHIEWLNFNGVGKDSPSDHCPILAEFIENEN